MKSFTLHLVVLFLFGIQQNVYSSSLKATTESASKPLSLSVSKPIETTTVVLSSSFQLPQEQNNSTDRKIAKTSSLNSKSSKITETSNKNNKQKSRTARDLPIKNKESSQSSISSSSSSSSYSNNNNKVNNGISCTTLLKDGNKNVDCRELKQKDDEEQKQQQILKQEEQLKSLNQASQSLWHETQQSNRVRRTSKTPRTIQRLIAGHLTLTNDQAFSIRKTEPVTTDITKIVPVSSTTTNEPIIETQSIPTTSVGSTQAPPIRKPYRSRKYGSSIRRRIPVSTTTATFKPSIKLETYDEKNEKDDDEAFLEDAKESDNWDNGILRLSAGSGKEDNIKTKKKLDPNKTLSEQVKDGKYGLIEEELFKKRPKRPGILSYLQNKEFPHDNEKTLGGLNEEDIWLAEDHLLVIKGGGLNDNDKNEPWAPIDDYVEKDRPIKIPENPKVPPPFPIQLGANEPIQFVGDNQITFGNSPFFNESSPDTLSIYPTGNENKNQIENENNDKENISTRKGPYQGTTKLASVTNTNNEEGYFYPRGNPAWNVKNGTLFNPFLNFRPFDFPAVPPNGSVDEFLDQFDEDDPSLYYPPPYSFVYKSNYTNAVPAGPLVPGIVLPPPPNAFSRLEKGTTTRKPRPNRPSFRQKLTRVQDYKPKTIVVTPNPIASTTSTTVKYTTSIKSTTPSTTTTNLPQIYFDPNKDVQYSQPPSYGKVRYYTPSSKIYNTPATPTEPAPVQEIISFVPQMEIKPTKDDTLSLKTPIYYEYYDIKPTPAPTPEVYYKEILPPTVPPSPTIPLQHTTSPLPQPISQTYSSQPVTSTFSTPAPKQYSTRKHKPSKITTIKPVLRKPHKQYSSQGKTYLTPSPYNFDDYINIKPHPEIRPNGIAQYNTQEETSKPIYNPKPAPDFDREINSIRQTLQFFKGQQPNYDYHQSTHKPQPIYEYSFDVTGTNPTTAKPQFDTEPFQPMVKYSSPVDDVNGFRAITYPEVNEPNYYSGIAGGSSGSSQTQKNQNDPIRVQIIYDSTSRPENGFYSNAPQATHSTITQAQNPWISIEKQVVQEIGTNGLPITTRRPPKRRPSSRKIEQVPKTKFDGYFYNPPQAVPSQGQRLNNRYYEEPFSKHLSDIRKKLNPIQSQHQPSIQWNIENATNFNYVTPRPIFIQPNEQMEQYLRERTFEENSNPGNSWNIENSAPQQYKTINSNTDNVPQQSWQQQQPQQQQLQQPQQQQSQQPQLWSLESDINVNNIPYGRPQPNSDSEYIELYRPQPTRHKSHRDKYRDGSKSIKQNAEPFMQYLREVTPNENLPPKPQNPWGSDSNLNEPYARPSINRNVEIIEQQAIRPSHHYRQQQLQQQQQQPQRISGAESFKQYVHKITPNKNYNPHVQQVWRLENDTNVNRIPHGRPPINSNSEFISPQQRRPIYRENIREFAPANKLQQQQQQQQQQYKQQQQQHQQQPQQQQQLPCKWPRNCHPNSNGQQNNVVSAGHSLHSDTNINYGQKLPPLNPNSEFINPYQPFLSEYKQQSQNLVPKPIYNRPQPQPLIDNTNSNYQQESYQNMNNNQRQQQRPPK